MDISEDRIVLHGSGWFVVGLGILYTEGSEDLNPMSRNKQRVTSIFVERQVLIDITENGHFNDIYTII